ncbi:MAG: GPW/gp25 family protein [Acidobacteria bacterium]|nr:GPW/gp25 family protein [Acidobacteriota bacterium]
MTRQDFIGKGWRFPIKVNARGRLEWSDGPSRIQDSIWIIIKTALGERLMRPTFGAGVDDFVFESNSEINRAQLSAAIKDALLQWEPRIELDDVRVTSGWQAKDRRLEDLDSVSAVRDRSTALDSQVVVTIEYRLRTTNEIFNVVFPFYLEEGVG